MKTHLTDVEKYADKLIDLGIEYGPRILGAIVVLILGLWLVRVITKATGKAMAKRSIDPSLITFFKSLTNMSLKILVIITAMGMLGIEMTSFIAILGAAGLAVGLALSGTLQNFAGGVILMILKPFKVGDFIEAQGYKGSVKAISIFTTILNTVDKKVVYIPNGGLSTGSLTNYSQEPQRRIDFTFGIAYGDDMEVFKKAITDFINEDEKILKDPEPLIGLAELADSSVNFTVRVWVNAENYLDVFFLMNEKVYKRFGDYGLNIPFPQMDVHMQK